jgi:hypothetical protein
MGSYSRKRYATESASFPKSVNSAPGSYSYATFADLPASGSTPGNTAFVVATNKLYIWSGVGWYLIATVTNASPTAITGVSDTYALATDGTATTVTAVSTDPEGFALTWSYAVSSGSLGSIATVAQADNVFTITPSTNTANAGTFSLTFSVTDGLNGVVSAVSAFTLLFSVTNSRYTALSVKANATGSNQTFDDASTSNHTITANGDTTASTFSPYRHGGYSTYFDGTGDYLTGPSSATIGIGTGDFTIECWFYATDGTSVDRGIWETRTDGYPNNSDGLSLTRITETTFRVYGTSQLIVSSATTITNSWHHLAVVRNSGTLEFFVNGVSQGTVSNSTNMNSAQPIAIGSGRYTTSNSTPTHPVNGYIRDFRVLTSALYTSNFTPPTEPLTAITNTKFLLGQLPYFKDQSTSNYAITVGGNASLEPKSVFDNAPYSEASHGASVYFDGSGDYITAADHEDFNMGSENFTAECWIYPTASPSQPIIMGQWSGSYSWALETSNNSSRHLRFLTNAGGIADNVSSTVVPLNQWSHIALVRNGTSFVAYLNGTSVVSSTVTGALANSTDALSIGASASGSYPFKGHMSDVRVVKGTAVYTSNFTPPAAPLTAITNTKFLLNPETSISDLSQSSEITCFGDAATDATTVKFAGTRSIAFDGTDDYLSISNFIDFETNSWTIEGWYWFDNFSTNQGMFTVGRNNGCLAAMIYNTDKVRVLDNYVTSLVESSTSISAQSWTHIAITFTDSDNTIRIFINGNLDSNTGTKSGAWTFTDKTFQLGARYYSSAIQVPMTGYVQDFRITKGLTRYTANFTPPTAELQG